MRQLVSGDDFIIQFRGASFGGHSAKNRLDNLLLEVLGLLGESDTATIAKALAMNQKTTHRRLARLHFEGRVDMKKKRQFFIWSRRTHACLLASKAQSDFM